MVKGDRQLEVSWTAASDKASGIDNYVIVASEGALEAPASCSRGTVLYEGSATSTTLRPGLPTGSPTRCGCVRSMPPETGRR